MCTSWIPASAGEGDCGLSAWVVAECANYCLSDLLWSAREAG